VWIAHVDYQNYLKNISTTNMRAEKFKDFVEKGLNYCILKSLELITLCVVCGNLVSFGSFLIFRGFLFTFYFLLRVCVCVCVCMLEIEYSGAHKLFTTELHSPLKGF
jgi:hypothetical protein